jgi:hypothetical protein
LLGIDELTPRPEPRSRSGPALSPRSVVALAGLVALDEEALFMVADHRLDGCHRADDAADVDSPDFERLDLAEVACRQRRLALAQLVAGVTGDLQALCPRLLLPRFPAERSRCITQLS